MDTNNLHELFRVTRGVRTAVVGVLVVLGIFLLVETASVFGGLGRPAVPATDTITVQGDGQATLPPDVAQISFTVQNTAAAVADAQAATTKQANAVLAFVKGQGIADKDVKTLSYNITPQYSYSYPAPCAPGTACPDYVVSGGGSPRVTGYQVSETIQVTEHDLTAVGALVGGLGKLGVQNVDGPSFTLEDTSAGYDAARADAITKAKAQADILANQLGVHLGKIVNFSESSGNYPVYSAGAVTAMSAAAAPAPTPSVPVGQNTYNASVSITYEIR
ncbi:MAG: SIMPL domain-containing protein [Minisyncoccia bacterium]